MLNAKPPFIFWRRSAFYEVNECALCLGARSSAPLTIHFFYNNGSIDDQVRYFVRKTCQKLQLYINNFDLFFSSKFNLAYFNTIYYILRTFSLRFWIVFTACMIIDYRESTRFARVKSFPILGFGACIRSQFFRPIIKIF